MANKNLLEAVKNNDLDRTRILIESGMSNANNNILEKYEYNQTALHWASWNGCLKIAKLLVKSYVAINVNISEKTNSGFTALHVASERGHLEIVKLLIDNGSDISEKDYFGQTALHWASKKMGHFNVVKYLVKVHIDTGVNIDIVNNVRETAIDVARRKDIKDFLMEQLEIQKNSYVLK